MTAIAGIFGKSENSLKEATGEMLARMAHRGEDMESFFSTDQLTMGTRASNISKTRGNGLAEDDNIAIVFDGELYNSDMGEMTDAEFALKQYKIHGRGFARYLDGVFACAVYTGNEVILIRDQVGVRPMYYGKNKDGAFIFSSELKGLAGLSEVDELLPGALCSSYSGVAAYMPGWPEVNIADDFAAVRGQVRKNLVEAVEKRLDDGAVGVCLLSGGLDSTIIAAIVRELGVKMPLLTVGVEGAPDIENAKIAAADLGMEHHVRTFDLEEIKAAVPNAVKALESFDEDCVSGTISNLFASAFAKKWTNCILSGEGGDELFGGYHLLKDVPGEGGKLKMMEKLVSISYNTALQRLDRSMMGNGIHYRTPFLDEQVIALALQTPVSWKIHETSPGNFVEKYILREAFRDILPDVIYRRVKLRFAAGAGTDNLMDKLAESQVSSEDFEQNRVSQAGYQLVSPKELWYYRIFQEIFPETCFERLVGRWDPFK